MKSDQKSRGLFDGWEQTNSLFVYENDWDYDYPFRSDTPGNEIIGRSDLLVVDGEPIAPVLSRKELKYNSYYIDKAAGKIYLKIRKALGKFEVERALSGENGSGAYILDTNSSDYVVLHGLTFTNCASLIWDRSMVQMGKPQHILVEDCAFNNSGTAEQTLRAETWRMVEVTYESGTVYADPFNDVTLDLLLYGNGRLYTAPGFWDGGGTWKVRFVCPAAGTWQCRTVCSDETNAALHGRTAQVECTAYGGDLEIYQRGFVTTRYGEKYLTYEDGTPFYYLGDTHWQLAQETPEIVAAICEKRTEQGFTAVPGAASRRGLI